MNIVEVNKIVKKFGDLNALDGVSLNVKEKEIYGLLGPNGAGKSTLIKILCGMLKISSGEVKCFDMELSKNLINIKKEIGIVPQEIAIYPDLTAEENVKFFASLYGIKGKLLLQRTEEALGFVGLLDRKKEYPKTFSGGMNRRLNIACAIAHHPKLIIMDEPTVGIDPQSRNHILDSVVKLNSIGSTIIYTTHYMEEVEKICSRIGIIDHGKLIAEGTVSELQNLISDQKRIDIEVDIENKCDLDLIKGINGVINVVLNNNIISIDCLKESDCLEKIVSLLSKNNVNLKNINMSTGNLESTFLALTGRKLRD